MTFGEILFKLRNEKQLGKDELASSLCVSAAAVEKWERNESMPSADELKRIAELFDLDDDYFEAHFPECIVNTCAADAGTPLNVRSHIRFTSDAFHPSFTEEEIKTLKWLRRKRAIFGAVDFLLLLIALAVFLTQGLTREKWHPAWAAFPAAIALGQLMYVLGYKRTAKVVLIDCAWLASITAYLVVGIIMEVWHPTWIIFIVDALVTVGINILCETKKKHK